MTTNNYVLGRGKIYFDRFAPGTETLTGERYLGNTPEFSVSVETEEQEHFSSEEGLRIKDESVTLQIDYTGSLVTDNIDPDNLAAFFLGESTSVTEAGVTGTTETFTVKKGRYYQMGRSQANPVGLRATTISTVEDAGGGGTTYVAGTDYEVDDDLGRIYIMPEGNIADDADIDVTYDAAGQSHDLVISGSSLLSGAVRFLAFNGVGKQTDFYMPKVTLRPNGEMALKGDDWQQFGFNLEILKKAGLANIYADGRPYNLTP